LSGLSPTSTHADPRTATVGVVFGGPSPEHDVSILTGLQATRTLVEAGREVFGLYWSKTGDWYRVPPTLEAADFLDGVPRRADPLRLALGTEGGFSETGGRLGRGRTQTLDVAVICCHGGPGEDGTLQGAFDLAGIRYTGPGPAAAALGMDKLAFAGLVAEAGLPLLPRRLLATTTTDSTTTDATTTGGSTTDATTTDLGFPGPYIVKPRYGGSSLGIDIVEDAETAVARLDANPHLRQGAVVEPYRTDLFDLNIAVSVWPEPALSGIERPLRSTETAEILNYRDKYVGGEGMASAPRELPAQLPAELTASIRSAALEIARLAAVRGVARIDFLSNGEAWFVNEVNTVPGSLARYLWVDPPVAFLDLLDAMIGEALSNPTWRPTAAGADGMVLRSAGGIAAKLG
jgi:D-alanine-D-alanine ligase